MGKNPSQIIAGIARHRNCQNNADDDPLPIRVHTKQIEGIGHHADDQRTAMASSSQPMPLRTASPDCILATKISPAKAERKPLMA